MYEIPHDSRDWNPQDSANFLSKIFFSYQDRTLKKTYKGYLTENDLFDIRSCDRAELVHDNLKVNWIKKQTLNKEKKGNFIHAILNTTIFKIMSIFILGLLEELFKIGQAVILGQLLRYFSGEISESMAYGLAVLLALCCFFPGVCHHNFFYNLQAIGMRTRVASCSMLYQKFLNISNSDFYEMGTGKAVNLISNDVVRFDFLFIFAPYFILGPFQLIIVTAFCWYTIGWYSLVGIALLPLIGLLLLITPRAYRYLRKKTALLTDQRLLYMNELLNAIKVIKASCWEDHFLKVVAQIRKKEIKRVFWARILEGLPPALAACSIKLAMFTIIITLLFVNKFMPSSSQVYQVLTALAPTRVTILVLFPLALRMSAESWISSRRIEEILKLNDKFTTNETEKSLTLMSLDNGENDELIVAENVTMNWQDTISERSTLKNLTYKVKRGSLVAVIGPVGSGKTSFLHSILGEMFEMNGTLKHNGMISYSSQEPWLFNGTLRQNVLFGSPLDEKRLSNVYDATCLLEDLKHINQGDMYSLGDRGSGLSGGQKARVSLARAIYRKANIYLLDEPLGALDIKTGEHLFSNCIKHFLKGKTILLATHQVQFLKQCDWIIILNEGQISHQGTFDELEVQGIDFSSFEKSEINVTKKDAIDETEEIIQRTHAMTLSEYNQSAECFENIAFPDPGKESMIRGGVDFSVYMHYVYSGSRNWFNALVVLFMFTGSVVLYVLTDWWLAEWLTFSELNSNNTDIDNSSLISSDNLYYLNIFVGFTFSSIIASIIRCVLYTLCIVNATRVMHNEMFNKILRAPLYFFSINPIGIILNRFSKDVGAMDDIIPQMLQDSLECGIIVLGLLAYIAAINPVTLIVIIPYIAVSLFLRKVYLKCGQDVKRLDAITRTPVFSHLNNTLLGISTIRAFNMELRMIQEFNELLDNNTKAFNLFLTTQKWFQLRLEIISSIFVLLSAFTFVGLKNRLNIPTSETGLSLSYAVTMLGLFQWAVRQSAETSSHMTSVERVLEYSKLDGEPENNPPLELDEKWPSKAIFELKNVNFQYGPETDKVLRNINISIKEGDKVGIVGRTGAGKSSLFNAILRLGTTTGTVLLDGIDISKISLKMLRSHVALIPQDPVFFTCSLRLNLDPFDHYSDDEIWFALEQAEMKREVQRNPLGLQMMITEGGGSLSIGQRQLLCLARALLQNCLLLLIDEATANVDRETDALVQVMIRKNFQKCTILTVAHRLDTIVDSDYILVFDQGELVENGNASDLLNDRKTKFYKLAAEGGKSELSRLTQLAFKRLSE